MKNWLCTRIAFFVFIFVSFFPAAPLTLIGQEAETESTPPWTVSIDSAVDIFSTRLLFDDYVEKKPAYQGSPYVYQGTGDTALFQKTGFDDPLEARLKFEYVHERFGGLLQLRAANDSGFSGAWDWEAWGKPHPFLKILAGNQGQRGSVERYQNFDDFLRTKIDNFGIMFPTWQRTPVFLGLQNNIDTVANFPYGYAGPDQNKGFAVFTGTDTTDLFTPAGSLVRQDTTFLLEGSFKELLQTLPFRLNLALSAGGLFQNQTRPFKNPWGASGGRSNEYDTLYDPLETTKTSFAARLEGSRIDLPGVKPASVSLVYKYAASGLLKAEAPDKTESLDEKIDNHSFGAYVNMETPLPGFSFSLGYSGLYQSWKNAKYEDTDPDPGKIGTDDHKLSEYKEVRFPWYNGIDLRFNYTGVPRLNLTLNNNISFADISGTVNKKMLYSKGWAYETQLNEDTTDGIENRKESYFGLYNALGVSYEVTAIFKVDFQAANQLGIFTLNWEGDPLSSISNYLGLYSGVTYTFAFAGHSRASIHGGIALRCAAFSFQSPKTEHQDMPVNKAGYVDLGFPFGLKIEFAPAAPRAPKERIVQQKESDTETETETEKLESLQR